MSVEMSKSCSTTKDLGNFEPRFVAPLQPKRNWNVHRKSWGFKFNIPCKALHQTGWAGQLLAWPPSSWKRACTACCNSYYAGSWGRNWSELAPGTPMAPDTTAKENKGVRMQLRLFYPFCIWDLSSPSKNNLCFQPQSLPSLHQTHQSSPPNQHGSTSSWQCSHPRSAQPCCLRPVRFWIWNAVNWMFAVWSQKNVPVVSGKPLTSSLLMGTVGCKRFPISRRYSKRSASSITLSLSIFPIASSTNSRIFLIWVTVRVLHANDGHEIKQVAGFNF